MSLLQEAVTLTKAAVESQPTGGLEDITILPPPSLPGFLLFDLALRPACILHRLAASPDPLSLYHSLVCPSALVERYYSTPLLH